MFNFGDPGKVKPDICLAYVKHNNITLVVGRFAYRANWQKGLKVHWFAANFWFGSQKSVSDFSRKAVRCFQLLVILFSNYPRPRSMNYELAGDNLMITCMTTTEQSFSPWIKTLIALLTWKYFDQIFINLIRDYWPVIR